jgi:cytoskeletal protein RodZ
MESLGEHLKRERELRGVTIEEIAHITRIGTRFLHAIENNDYGSLPDVLVKGFLRAYAKCVGLNPNEIISIYENVKTKEEKIEIKEAEKSLPYITSAYKTKISKSISFIAATALILTIAGGFVYYKFAFKTVTEPPVKKGPALSLIQEETKAAALPQENYILPEEQKPLPAGFNQGTEDSPAENPSPPLQSAANLNPAIQPIPLDKIQESYNVKKEEDTSSPELVSGVSPIQTRQKPLTLSIAATEAVWLQVVIDDSETKEATLEPGEKFFVKAQEKFSLTTGNIKGTEVTFNGVKLSLPSTRSNVLRNYVIKEKG